MGLAEGMEGSERKLQVFQGQGERGKYVYIENIG